MRLLRLSPHFRAPLPERFLSLSSPSFRHAATDEERLARISRSLRWTVMASLAVLVPLGLTAEFFIPFVFGDEFSESVFPLLLLLPGAFASDVNQIFATALAGFNQPEKASRAQVYSAIATVIGCWPSSDRMASSAPPSRARSHIRSARSRPGSTGEVWPARCAPAG